jgi:hypothetical protein
MPMDRLDPKVERIFRKALGHAARAEMTELAHLIHAEDEVSNEQLAACLGLCAWVTAYTAIDVCGGRWPNTASVRRMAEGSATVGEIVKRTGLTPEDAYEYASRVALGFEALEEVFPDPDKVSTVPFLVASNILATYGPREQHWWEFLNVIEDAFERAWVTDLHVLPALMVLSRMSRQLATGPGREQADSGQRSKHGGPVNGV